MRTRGLVVVFLFFILYPMGVGAQDVSRVSGVKEVCSRFLSEIVAGDYNGAFAFLRTMPNAISEKDFSELEILAIQQSSTIRSLYGGVVDVELVEEKRISDFALKLVYVVLRENHIIRWRFIYYKPEQTWRLNSIAFDDEIESLF